MHLVTTNILTIHGNANVCLKDILPKVNFKDQSSDNIEMRLRGCMIKQVNFWLLSLNDFVLETEGN